MKVAGKNVVVFINVSDVWTLYACALSATLNVITDVIETSTSGNGKWGSYLPTKNSWTGTLTGVTSFESNKLSLRELRAKQFAQETFLIKYQRSDGDGNLYTESGYCFITSSSDEGSFDGMNSFTVDVQGTGALTPDSDSEGSVPFDFNYGFTEAETVIDGWIGILLPTEAGLVASVDDVFTAGDEQTGSEPNTGDDVGVADFTNTIDKVLFLQVPASEAPFTKWSEAGNPLQQNQPIDSSFNWGSGAVWFKTTREGDTLYVTYYQTKFAGTIIFSR